MMRVAATLYIAGLGLSVVIGAAIGGWFILWHGAEALPELLKFYCQLSEVICEAVFHSD